MQPFYPFIYKKDSKETEPLPLYLELIPPPPPEHISDEEEERVIIIEIL